MYSELLTNYNRLVSRVDLHIAGLHHRYPEDIVCCKGCDDCCRHLNLFPVEAVSLAVAFDCLEEPVRHQIRLNITTTPDTCPLLINHTCCLYDARPVICRTHGYPITMEKDGQLGIDFCPKNFSRITEFQNNDLLSLEQVNTTLLAVNRHFLSNIETDQPLPERISMAEALLMFS